MAPDDLRLTRRAIIGGTVAAVVTTARGGGGGAQTPPGDDAGPFRHGVASGDPLADRVVLWTRVTVNADTAVRWTVATDPELTEQVSSGDATASADADGTVHVDVEGLAPATTYYYAFEAGGRRSPVGRTRTAPAGPTDHLRLAVVSCARYAAGWFNVCAAVARQPVDLVVHLGDFIYEDGGEEVRAHDPPHRLVTLDDYRRRHAQHRTDPDLVEMLRLHPIAAIWDDHDLAGGAWRDGAKSHEDGRDGPWPERRDAAARAWREWLPIRLPDAADELRIWRRLPLGDLADLTLLDTRIYGRDRQVPPDGAAADLDDPNRSLLGEAQRTFVLDGLRAGTARWQLVANQVMFAPLVLPVPPNFDDQDLRDFGLVRTGTTARNPDQWDGYTAERGRVLDAARTATGRTVVLTGDVHSSWAWTVGPDDRPDDRPVAELVAPSIAGESFADMLGLGGTAADLAETGLSGVNPKLDYVETAAHGWMTVDVTPDRVHADWWYVAGTDERSPEADHGGGRILGHGASGFETAASPAEPPEPEPTPADAPEPREPSGEADTGTSRWVVGGVATAAVAALGAAVVRFRGRRGRG